MTNARGLRVLEVGTTMSGAYCGWLLRGLGADVTRIAGADTGKKTAISRAIDCLNLGKNTGTASVFGAGMDDFHIIIADDVAVLEKIWGKSLDEIAAGMPGKVVGVASVFGLSGPLSIVAASEIDAQAVSSVAWVLGEAAREPLTIPPEILASQSGAHLAAAVLGAQLVPGIADRARIVDVALADVLASYVAVNCRFYIHHGMSWRRSGRRASDSGGAYPFVILPCKDGQVCLSGRTKAEWLRLVEALGSPEWAAEPRYQSLRRMGREYPEEVDALLVPHFAGMTKAEIADMADRHRLTISPVRSFGDVLDTRQFECRHFWRDVKVDGKPIKAPGMPFIVSDTRQEGATPITTSLLGKATGCAKVAPFDSRRPLAGLRVIDLGWVWSAPQVSGLLAQFGAEVIKVEHGKRIDSMRLSGSVLVDGKVIEGETLDMAPMYHQINRGKKGITLNLKEPRAIELLKSLIADSGIVIENMSPGSLDRAGLGFDALRAERPDLVMLAMSGAGQFGPLADMRTYAPVMSSFVGLEALIGYPGESPVGAMNFALGDPNAAVHGLAALFAALIWRRTTGKGCYIDLSQTEALLATLLPFVMQAQTGGAQPLPRGNAHPDHCPHGVYPSGDPDGWLTIAVRNDSEWASLLGAIAPDGWHDVKLDLAENRLSGRAQVDGLVSEWTRRRPATQTVTLLRDAGVPAARVNDISGVWADPQYAARNLFAQVELPFMGPVPMAGPPWRIDGFNPKAAPRGPKLGEHNDSVFRDLLRLDPEEIAKLKAGGVIS